MKAGIVLDAWKLPIFERHLRDAGFTWVNAGKFAKAAITLTVVTDDVVRLAEVLKAAQDEAARSRGGAVESMTARKKENANTEHPGEHVRCRSCHRHPDEMRAGRFTIDLVGNEKWLLYCADCRADTFSDLDDDR